MKDARDREIGLGDEVAFTVGTSILTGIVVKLRQAEIAADWMIPVAKVRLSVPELSGGREPKQRLFRDVRGSYRIILLKPLDN